MKKFLWFFDYDGTLSPTVSARQRAEMDEDCRQVLQELALKPEHLVAVLSSRAYADLAKRLPLQNIYIGASSGIIWSFPDGTMLRPDAELSSMLARSRKELLPALQHCATLPGVELEDKMWSAALHFRPAPIDVRQQLSLSMESLRRLYKIGIFSGPDIFEIQFIAGIDKSYGASRLCRALGVTPAEVRLIYAGDDENDGLAMKWIIENGGVAITVGQKPLISGASAVENPGDLAAKVRELSLHS